MVDDFAQRLQSQGLSMEQYFQFTGLTNAKMMEQVKPNAENKIKSRLVLEAVVKAENLVATEEDFDAEAHSLSEDGWQLIIPNLPLDPVFGFQQELKL